MRQLVKVWSISNVVWQNQSVSTDLLYQRCNSCVGTRCKRSIIWLTWIPVPIPTPVLKLYNWIWILDLQEVKEKNSNAPSILSAQICVAQWINWTSNTSVKIGGLILAPNTTWRASVAVRCRDTWTLISGLNLNIWTLICEP